MTRDLLLKSARIIDPDSPHHLKVLDILVRNGKIAKIAKAISAHNVEVFEHKGLHVSPGWVDLKANFRDPGFEFKEDISSGIKAAAKGGFTKVLVMPSTEPPVDGRGGVEYLKKRSTDEVVSLLPSGTISRGLKGEQLAELYDMHQSGAVAFTDDKSPVKNSKLMLTALLYAKNFGSRIISFAHDAHIAANGVVHEGAESTALGLTGIPALAEKLQLERDLSLVEYADGSCHFSTISTGDAVASLKKAKKNGLNVSCDVAAHHLLLSDKELVEFDSAFKLMPPLRDKQHIKTLKKGLKDGTIDAICSDHCPEDIEHKDQEFGAAAYGAIGLETAFAVANTALKDDLELTEIVAKFTSGPRKVLGLEAPCIAEGAEAELTLFDPKVKWTVEKSDILSKSKNSPLIGRELVGKALGVVNGGKASI